MNKRDIINDLFRHAFTDKKGVFKSPLKENILPKLRDLYSLNNDTKDKDFSEFHQINGAKTKYGKLFFIQQGETFKFLPISEIANNKDFQSLSIATIQNCYYETKINPEQKTIKLIAFLFGYSLTPEQVETIEGLREDTDVSVILNNYVKNIHIGNSREDVLVQIIDYFTSKHISSITICTNDLGFIFQLLISIIQFINEGKKLTLLFDPPSMFDVLSFRLVLIQRLGALVYILPFKNKYPTYGIFPNWDIEFPTKLPSEILIFKTNYFQTNRSNRAISSVIKDQNKIQQITADIIYSHSEINPSLSSIKLNNKFKLKIVKKSENFYIDFIKDKFNSYPKNSIYKNAQFQFIDIELTEIYRRINRFAKYKLFQQFQFMEYLIEQKFIEYSQDKTTMIFNPLFIELGENYLSSINMPFLEYNSITKKYEVVDGHIRLWLCYHYYKIKKIRTILVEGIEERYFERMDENIDFNINSYKYWNQTISMLSEEALQNDDLLYPFRDIDGISHYFKSKDQLEYLNKLFDELVDGKILNKEDKKYHNYLIE